MEAMRTEQWEEYHRGGWVVSLPMGSRDGYTGELLSMWQRFFAELPPGARIIDIGTGNGAIPLIARDTAIARRRVFDIHGVDLAAIDPPACVAGGKQRYVGITFHPRTAAESLPFEDGSVCAVTGQYALEYTRIPECLAEIVRVLGASGSAQFVVHHADSILAVNARRSLGHGEVVRRERVFERLRQFLEAERLEPGRARGLHRQLSRIGSDLRALAAESTTSPIIDAALAALARVFEARGRIPLSDLLRALEQSEHALRAALLRLEDILEVAKSQGQMDDILARADALGLSGTYAEQLQDHDMLIGWRLALTRSGRAQQGAS